MEVETPAMDPTGRRSRLKYVCLVYGEEKKIGAMTDDECMTYDQALRNSGLCLASEALQPVRIAVTVRVRNGQVSVRDGLSRKRRNVWQASI
jgi:hypothetical protein